MHGPNRSAGGKVLHGDYAVSVTPDGAADQVPINTGGHTYDFVITNTGACPDGYGIAVSKTGTVTTATADPTSVALNSGESAPVTVTYSVGGAGTGTITVTAGGSYPAFDEGSLNVTATPPPANPVVTPHSASVTALPNSGIVQRFSVQNVGAGSAIYNLDAVCTGAVSNCPVLTPLTVPAGTAVNVNLHYQTGASGSGTVMLRAVDQAQSTLRDSGTVSVSIGGAIKTPIVDVVGVNPGLTLERSLCLTIAVGADAAAECGDLRLVHSLPAIRTLNKLRAPELIYTSAQANPYPLVAANIQLPSGGATPDSVVARLIVGGAEKDKRVYAGSDFTPGSMSRVALRVDTLPGDGSYIATGVYRDSVIATFWYAGSRKDTTAVGLRAVVNRVDSPFGAGWWIAGVERLYFPPLPDTNAVDWVGGDGSFRRYLHVSGTSIWRATSLTRPDSITKDGSSNYWRYLPHGVKVQFNNQGLHVATFNRLQHKTRFTYDLNMNSRLDSIVLPPDNTKFYRVIYNATTGLVDSVIAPPAAGQVRTTKVTYAGRRLTTIRDPNPVATTISFGYTAADSNRIVSRTDARNTVTTYSYDMGKKVARDSLDLGNGSQIVSTVRSAESQGLGSAVDTAVVYTKLDGPRVDVGDTTSLWLDRLGEPKRIRNALGFETMLTRADPTFASLITKTRAPNGRVLSAAYDGRGNILETTDSSHFEDRFVVHCPPEPPCGPGSFVRFYATTRYSWDPVWDFAISVVPPEGDSTVMSYDAANGNRLWQQDARGTATRVAFGYNGLGLLASIDPPLTPPDSLFYGTLGNLTRTKSALGLGDSLYQDAVGRDTLRVSPVDSARTKWQRQRVVYDVMDRVTLTATTGPAIAYQTDNDPQPVTVGAQTLTTQNFYDLEGHLDSLWRSSSPDTNHVGVLKTRWSYDAAGRPLTEVSPDGLPDSTSYDPAGNAVRVRTRRGHSIMLTYDPLNRIARRIVDSVPYPAESVCAPGYSCISFPAYHTDGLTIPTDTATFTYDSVGNLRSAWNRDARVSRGYNRNGTIAADSLWIRNWAGTTFSHLYVLQPGYDLNGRRTTLVHPSNIAPRVGQTIKDLQRYTYSPNGQLASVTDVLGLPFQYFYDVEGRLDSVSLPGQIYEKRSYDDDGRLRRRIEGKYYAWGPPDSGFTRDTIRDETFSHDARDKMTKVKTFSVMQPAFEWHDSTMTWYSGLGHVVASRTYDFRIQQLAIEQFRWDALANLRWTSNYVDNSALARANITRYQTPSGRLITTTIDASTAVNHPSADSSRYDASGNRNLSVSWDYWPSLQAYSITIAASYYDAEQRLRVLDRRQSDLNGNAPSETTGPYEEYRYDALGRRILVRSRHDLGCAGSGINPCSDIYSVIERYVWDGDQVLYEIRSPGGDNVTNADLERDTIPVYRVKAPFGRVVYTHGLEIDRPLDVIRMGYSSTWSAPVAVIPHTNWRSSFDQGTFDNGAYTHCTKNAQGFNSGDCVFVDWPGDNQRVFENPGTVVEPRSWFGHQVSGQRDFSGLFYRRNRYYDAFQGRFTQEDPIGLAGGLNAYGFAGGDPVNFGDPFGLCPDNLKDKPEDCAAWDKQEAAKGGSAAACGTSGVGGGIGFTLDANADLGIADAGATANGFAGAGLFYDSKTGLSTGGLAGGALVAYAGSHVAATPQQDAQPGIFGAFAGGGGSVFFTNGRSVRQVCCHFTTTAVNVGLGVFKFSVRYASAGSTKLLSIGPPKLGVSYGLSVTRTVTNTATQHRGCK